jgi:hypothetical protein
MTPGYRGRVRPGAEYFLAVGADDIAQGELWTRA